MKTLIYISLLLVIIRMSAAVTPGEAKVAEGWNRLAVTWGKFTSLPITESGAKRENFKLIREEDCGKRYIDSKGDIGTVPIYDHSGAIAGIELGSENTPPPAVKKFWNERKYNGKVYYSYEFYFIKPDTLCKRETRNSIGDRLAYKLTDGTVVNVPLVQSLAPTIGLVEGKCFVSMGKHYWSGISRDMRCDTLEPLFAMYNRGKLNSFGIAIPEGKYESSERYEKPPQSTFGLFFLEETYPQCLKDQGRQISTMHVFFTNAAFNFC